MKLIRFLSFAPNSHTIYLKSVIKILAPSKRSLCPTFHHFVTKESSNVLLSVTLGLNVSNG